MSQQRQLGTAGKSARLLEKAKHFLTARGKSQAASNGTANGAQKKLKTIHQDPVIHNGTGAVYSRQSGAIALRDRIGEAVGQGCAWLGRADRESRGINP